MNLVEKEPLFFLYIQPVNFIRLKLCVKLILVKKFLNEEINVINIFLKFYLNTVIIHLCKITVNYNRNENFYLMVKNF